MSINDLGNTPAQQESMDQLCREHDSCMFMIDLSKLPLDSEGQPADYIISNINGGLTIFAKVGNYTEQYGDTPQEALDNAIAFFHEQQQ